MRVRACHLRDCSFHNGKGSGLGWCLRLNAPTHWPHCFVPVGVVSIFDEEFCDG